MWAIEREGRERGFRRTPALSTGRAMLRDGFNEWCVRKKKRNSDISDIFLLLQDIDGFARSRLGVRVRMFCSVIPIEMDSN